MRKEIVMKKFICLFLFLLLVCGCTTKPQTPIDDEQVGFCDGEKEVTCGLDSGLDSYCDTKSTFILKKNVIFCKKSVKNLYKRLFF